jgi:hypothetical protein
MILNGSAHVFLNLNKNNKQSLKIYPGTQRKLGMLNVIKQLQHFILCNMVCYGAQKSNIDCGLRPWSISAFVNIAFQCSITPHIGLNEVQ